jgi:hypothetical protein
VRCSSKKRKTKNRGAFPNPRGVFPDWVCISGVFFCVSFCWCIIHAVYFYFCAVKFNAAITFPTGRDATSWNLNDDATKVEAYDRSLSAVLAKESRPEVEAGG